MSNRRYCLYKFVCKEGNILYVGKSINIDARIKQHSTAGHLPNECYMNTAKVEIIDLASRAEMDIKEIYYINKYNPKYNQKNKYDDDVSFITFENDTWVDYGEIKLVVDEVSALKREIKKLESKLDFYKNKHARSNENRPIDNVKLNLSEIMNKKGVTQMELSEATGVRQASISSLCRNSFERLHMPSINKIARHLEVKEVGELFYSG